MLCSNCSMDNQQYSRLVVMRTTGEGQLLLWRLKDGAEELHHWMLKSFLIEDLRWIPTEMYWDVKDSKQKPQLGIISVSIVYHEVNWQMEELLHEVTLR